MSVSDDQEQTTTSDIRSTIGSNRTTLDRLKSLLVSVDMAGNFSRRLRLFKFTPVAHLPTMSSDNPHD
ncbi:hypothetical protein KCU95_g87, partial [Aureobasidium melanogenum]